MVQAGGAMQKFGIAVVCSRFLQALTDNVW